MYSLQFSRKVVDDFIAEHTRAWGALCDLYPHLTYSDLVEVFQKNQKVWYFLKQTIKLVERLGTRPDLFNPERIKRNVEWYRLQQVDKVKKSLHS